MHIKAYYAGHVLGAAMFQVTVGSESIVYTVYINKALSMADCELTFSFFRVILT